MGKRKKSTEEDMSQTFIAEVGQKSAIADDKYDDIEITKKKEKNNEEDKENIKNKNDSKEFDYYDEVKKTSSPAVLVVVVAIVALIIGVAGGYYLFKVMDKEEIKTEKKKENINTKKEIKEELNPEGLYIQELISRYDQADISSNINIYEVLYKEDKTTIKDIDENYLKVLAANKASGVTGVFTSEEFKNATKLLYGNSIEFDDGKINYNKGCIIVNHNDDVYTYVEGECGGASTISMKRKIVKTEIDEDVLTVNVAVAIIDSNEDKVYKNYSKDEKELEEVDNVVATTFDIDNDYTELNQYKYTFNYDKDNNNYYLVSIELVK